MQARPGFRRPHGSRVAADSLLEWTSQIFVRMASISQKADRMMPQNKVLLIVSVDTKVNQFLRTIIQNIIGSRVTVLSQRIEECASKPTDPDVVMTSGPFLLGRVRAVFPDKVIIGLKRMITGHNLEKVLMLPRGTRALVVNSPRSATEDTIDSLRSLGITHLEYIPYWRGAKPDLDTVACAISPGMSHLCPKKINRIIDIGPRIISIHSFLELLVALDLDLSYLEDLVTYYQNSLMESSRKLASVLEQSELLRKYQEIILNQFEDGLLSVREDGTIDIANKSTARLFKRNLNDILSSNISDLLSGFKHAVNIMDNSLGGSGPSSIHEYDGKQILIQKIPVVSENDPRLIYTFREIAQIQRLEKNVRLHLAQKGHVTKYSFDDIWTRSKLINDLKEKALNFATTEKNILITGESGTGKELFAHAIHRSSVRREGPFVAVNFAGIPEGLIESELFGYESGAFTGAKKGGKIGFFEQAHGGTIFLDEIGDAPLNVQSRLLRVLQEKEIMKVGGSRITPIDVRIIAGTNRDLLRAMQENKFRTDLYYRLNTFPLEIPPLREHKEDLPHILYRYLAERRGTHKKFSSASIECLMWYGWPGNIRELLNLAEYVCISSRGRDEVELEHLPRALSSCFSPDESTTPKTPEDPQTLMRNILKTIFITPDALFCLLSILRERKNDLNGRRSLMKELQRRGQIISEGRMKSTLRALGEAGLIHIGTTKQGTVLSREGEQFLNSLL
jgi:sigma-54 dependent transcriptional regulator, acetoin dehydrogenase operon transcriptional activator AcoR